MSQQTALRSSSAKEHSPLHRKVSKDSSAAEQECLIHSKPYLRRSSRKPTHFVAVPLTRDASVSSAIKTVHTALELYDDRLRHACVPACTAHITLALMHLSSDETVRQAISALRGLGSKRGIVDHDDDDVQQGTTEAHTRPQWDDNEDVAPLLLNFRGLSTFDHKVLFMEPVSDAGLSQLKHLAAWTEASMLAAGVPIVEAARNFTPHLTIAKVSNMKGKAHKVRTIAQDAYAAQADIAAGPVSVQEVQLCSMGDRPPDCYYRVMASVALGNKAQDTV